MVIRGRVENGVVVFEADVNLPDGTEVSVEVREATEGVGEKNDRGGAIEDQSGF